MIGGKDADQRKGDARGITESSSPPLLITLPHILFYQSPTTRGGHWAGQTIIGPDQSGKNRLKLKPS